MDTLSYWIGLSRVKGIGPARLRRLITYFGTAESAWQAPYVDLIAAGLDPRTAETLITFRQAYDDSTDRHMIARANAKVLPFTSKDYPPLLRQISDPPPLLYVRGELLPSDKRAVAFVGTRSATDYGKAMVARLVEPLVVQGITIISGLAHGIDAAAHQAALRANGRTLAVLPCGIDRVYPTENAPLAAEILQHGALLTELLPGERAERGHFGPRNRIISGLSLGVVVVEAGEKSGALITADSALEQGREVFAVPGSPLSAASAGTNELIRAGATLVTRAEDILDGLGFDRLAAPQPVASTYIPASEQEKAILDCLGAAAALHIDEISYATHLPTHIVGGLLTVLEVKGAIRQVGILRYSLA
ncbi:MAG: DNA-processing protein DprA [Anaerolineae bacterium]